MKNGEGSGRDQDDTARFEADHQWMEIHTMDKYVKCVEIGCLVDVFIRVSTFFGADFFDELNISTVSGTTPLYLYQKLKTNLPPNRNLPELSPDRQSDLPNHKTILNLRYFARRAGRLQNLNYLAEKIPGLVQNLHICRIAIDLGILRAVVHDRVYNSHDRPKGTQTQTKKKLDHDQYSVVPDPLHSDPDLLFRMEHIYRESDNRHSLPLRDRTRLQGRDRGEGPDDFNSDERE